jgi:hypothetical protein
MRQSDKALKARRTAIGAERAAYRALDAHTGQLGVNNSRVWQSVMVDALRERSKVILTYLAQRDKRS